MGVGPSRKSNGSAHPGDGARSRGPSVPAGQWPYLHRNTLVHIIGAYVMKDRISEAKDKLLDLRQFCGMSLTLDPDSSSLCPNRESDYSPNSRTDCLISHLTKLIARQLDGWKYDFLPTIDKLSREFRPPYYKSPAIPDVGEECSELMMTGRDLYTNSLELKKLNKFIGSTLARQVVKLDLGFTGIDDTNLNFMLWNIVRMPKLAYLGLQGNRLTTTSLERLLKVLCEKDMFISMKWIDLSNNKDIFTLPPTFMGQLRRRWENETYSPSFAELVHNKVIISTETGKFIHNI